VIAGAGIVGLATAHRLHERAPGVRLAVVDKEPAVARHQTGHNSGVVHAGLYYTPGSLKARLCRAGAAALREKCAEWGIPVIQRGKLVVATDESELDRLDELERRGRENGIEGLEMLDEQGMRAIEPHVRGYRALHVPETAVVDYTLVAQKLADELQRRGVDILLGSPIESVAVDPASIRLVTNGGAIEAGGLVACAGLQSDRLARLAGAEPTVRIVPFRGAYWRLTERAAPMIRGLIYPVPDPSFPFLGVHFTRGADEGVTAGPNAVPAFAREGYSRLKVSLRDVRDAYLWPGFARLARRYAKTGTSEMWRDAVKRAALDDMRRYVPEIGAGDIRRGGSGIRAQAMARDGSLVDDFLIEDGPLSLHVLNAPSPAATSSLAIGEMIAERAAERFGL
jgi:L-2-hydroxyglutarate oxidase LhgO